MANLSAMWVRSAGILVLAAAGVASAWAQAWPVKPVKMVISTGPGLSTDIVGRMLCDRLSRSLGQTFVVENVAGAGGIIGAQAVARAAPDGYTYLFTGGGTLVTNLFAFKSLPYDPARDLTPVALVTRASGFVLLVPGDSPVKSVNDLVALSRSKPGQLSYAVDSSNIYLSLVGRMLNRAGGIDLTEIPYKSTPQAIQDTIAGRTQLLITSAASVESVARSGKLRRIAVSSSSRMTNYPDLPSLSESFPGLQLDAVGFSVVAPAGTPADIVQRLNRTLMTLIKDSSFEEQLAAQGQATSRPNTPEEAAEELRQQRLRWGRIFQDLGIRPQ